MKINFFSDKRRQDRESGKRRNENKSCWRWGRRWGPDQSSQRTWTWWRHGGKGRRRRRRSSKIVEKKIEETEQAFGRWTQTTCHTTWLAFFVETYHHQHKLTDLRMTDTVRIWIAGLQMTEPINYSGIWNIWNPDFLNNAPFSYWTGLDHSNT